MDTDVSQLRDHWWPRPGWRPGRIMLTWHLTFEQAPALHSLVSTYHRALAPLPGLNVVPPQWLHLTIQGVGYEDELPPADVESVIRSVRARVAGVAPFEATFSRPIVFGEAIAIRPEPAEPLRDVLTAIREGISSALGTHAVHSGPEQAHGFRPHVSIAYSHVAADAEPYRAAIASVDPSPAIVSVRTVTLIRQLRQLDPHWLYRWTTAATAPLTG